MPNEDEGYISIMTMTATDSKAKLKELNCCVILPTYNNEGTIKKVIEEVSEWCSDIYVVNDGSTDSTHDILKSIEASALSAGVTIIEYPDGLNRGKGYALKTGLRTAVKDGYRYAITMDSDGQHFASDLPVFIEAVEKEPDSMIIGARNLSADGMPGKNTFANKFSNFWFKVETLQTLHDTQSGYRLYPLKKIADMKFFTPRYEFEVESIVRLAWRDVKVINVPINVIYPEDRVSHFRPLHDFTRISILNTVLVTCALFYYYPICFARFIKRELIYSNENATKLSSAVALGVTIGIMPILGFQTIAALTLAYMLKLNKVIVVAFSNISLPPIIPFILYASLWTGCEILGTEMSLSMDNITLENAKNSLLQYYIGGIVFAIASGILSGLVTFGLIKIFRKK